MERYICIHGHFYQPPRENPWLESVEIQDSAYPYHDWNARITAECYGPNAASRILDGQGKIVQIFNNYSKISFNFGPTLLSWMQDKAPAVYEAILRADRESRDIFAGHGSALAQAYNHMILPLANRRDKHTQILWGIRDFETRFGRRPEGMWLPEAAVDTETLEILAELGILFTVLSPYQASKVKPMDQGDWTDVSGGNIDPTMAYRINLPTGNSLTLFFYDGPISRGVAFEGLLNQGELFARRLLDGFSDGRSWPQLVHIATDGESYGHHHGKGDMALAYALQYIEENKLATITNYGQYLERHPPTHEAQIHDNSSWSCVHGVERWRNNCGCHSGGYPQWTQEWRGPLRSAMDWLRDKLAVKYEQFAGPLLNDPWKARDDYITVILDRKRDNVDAFFHAHAKQRLSDEDVTRMLKLLELQRHAMLMYTSCGWFFDELSGIETVQIIQYAARAIQLAEEVFGGDGIEAEFQEKLVQAKSNIPEYRDGAHIYENFVRPAMVDLRKVVAHYAMTSLFEEYDEKARIFFYTAEREDYRAREAGKAKLVMGRAKIVSEVTLESARLMFGVLHFGDHNISCGVKPFESEEEYTALMESLFEPFERADFPETLRRLDSGFGTPGYSVRSLFRDGQRSVVRMLLTSTQEDALTVYQQLYDLHAPILRFLRDLNIPAPKVMYAAAEVAINTNLDLQLQKEQLDPEAISMYLEDARVKGVQLDGKRLEYDIRVTIENAIRAFQKEPTNLNRLRELSLAVGLLEKLPFEVILRDTQNIYYALMNSVYGEMRKKVRRSPTKWEEWISLFKTVGEKIGIQVS